MVIDGGGILHSSVYWPKEGLVQELIKRVEYYSLKFVNVADAYLLFDRYLKNSIKSNTRLERLGTYDLSHKLAIATPLPQKKIYISSTTKKENLIKIIFSTLMERPTREEN